MDARHLVLFESLQAEYLQLFPIQDYQNILQHSKQIDKLGEEYKRQDNDEAKKMIQQDMMKLLEERFTLQEKKMQLEIQKLSKGIANLEKELQKFREDKEAIIQRQYETYVE